MSQVIVSVSSFSKFPAGRLKSDGLHSGACFRDDVLAPLLLENRSIIVNLDGTLGYGSSFLEEVFGGLVRVHKLDPLQLRKLLTLETSDQSLVVEIWRYIAAA